MRLYCVEPRTPDAVLVRDPRGPLPILLQKADLAGEVAVRGVVVRKAGCESGFRRSCGIRPAAECPEFDAYPG